MSLHGRCDRVNRPRRRIDAPTTDFLLGRLKGCAIGVRASLERMFLPTHPNPLDVDLAPSFREPDGMDRPAIGCTRSDLESGESVQQPGQVAAEVGEHRGSARTVIARTRVLIRLEERRIDEVAVPLSSRVRARAGSPARAAYTGSSALSVGAPTYRGACSIAAYRYVASSVSRSARKPIWGEADHAGHRRSVFPIQARCAFDWKRRRGPGRTARAP